MRAHDKASEKDAVAWFQKRLSSEREAYTRQVLATYRQASAVFPALSAALWNEARAYRGELTVSVLTSLPAWVQLVTALNGALDAGTDGAQALAPEHTQQAAEDGAAFVSAVTGKDPDSHTASLAAAAAIALYLTRHKTPAMRERHERILAQRVLVKLRPLLLKPQSVPAAALLQPSDLQWATAPEAPQTAATVPVGPRSAGALAVREAVSERVSAGASESLRVLNTETANVHRHMVVDAVGHTGSWRWVTRRDKLVCTECQREDGRIHAASEIFDLVHVNCRCVSVPLVSWSVTHEE